MIKLTRLNGQELVINADLIKRVEAKPDTIITLTAGDQYIVKNTVDEIMDKVVRYKQEINSPQQ